MKKIVYILTAVLLCFAMLSCANQSKLIGTWRLVENGERLVNTSIRGAAELIFERDGSCSVVTDTERKNIEYRITSDTMTFDFGAFGFGIGYKVSGDTLILGENQKNAGAVFEKVS